MKKMNKLKVLTTLLLAALALPALAGTGSGSIIRIYIHSPNGSYSSSTEGVVMFSMSQHLNPPSCSSSEWAFSLDTARGRMMYALLLSAKAQKKSVIIQGDGTCSDWSDREKPYYIYYE